MKFLTVITVGVRHVPEGEVSVCVQHSDGQWEHTLRLPDSFLACCALSDLRFSFVTMSLAQVKTTVRVSPIIIDEHFRTAWLPFFCRADGGLFGLPVFDPEVGGCLPSFTDVDFPSLTGTDLCVVHKKKPTAGSLDGWGQRGLQALLIAWFEVLSVILVWVEFDGVWVQGLLDA